jgi:hypothetical protein
MVSLYDRFHQSQSQAGARPCPAPVAAVEPSKNVRQILSGNTDPGITDGDDS